MKTLITNDFAKALQHAETKAMFDLNGQWCVAIRYGVYGAFPLVFAESRDYSICAITIY